MISCKGFPGIKLPALTVSNFKQASIVEYFVISGLPRGLWSFFNEINIFSLQLTFEEYKFFRP